MIRTQKDGNYPAYIYIYTQSPLQFFESATISPGQFWHSHRGDEGAGSAGGKPPVERWMCLRNPNSLANLGLPPGNLTYRYQTLPILKGPVTFSKAYKFWVSMVVFGSVDEEHQRLFLFQPFP